MRRINLTKQEKDIEDSLEEYVDVSQAKFQEIAQAIAARKKDSVLNIRINTADLKVLKQKANKLGIKYQTFISEILHRIAQA